MTPGSARVTESDFEAALWRLLAASDRVDPVVFAREHDAAADLLAAATDPSWVAWRHAFDARRALVDADAADYLEKT